MAADIDPNSVAGAWSHSHEEDQGDTLVFRRAGYDFPRSRGRTSYDLKPGGDLGGSAPGPDDRHVATTGSWKLAGDRLTIAPQSGSPAQYQVQSIDGDRMVVKAIP